MSAPGPDAREEDNPPTSHFDYDPILHQQIDPILRIKLHTFVKNRDRAFGDESNVGCRQFELQTGHVSGLERARAKNSMDLYSGPDNVTGDDVQRRVDQHGNDRQQRLRLLAMPRIRRQGFVSTQILTTTERGSLGRNANTASPFLGASL